MVGKPKLQLELSKNPFDDPASRPFAFDNKLIVALPCAEDALWQGSPSAGRTALNASTDGAIRQQLQNSVLSRAYVRVSQSQFPRTRSKASFAASLALTLRGSKVMQATCESGSRRCCCAARTTDRDLQRWRPCRIYLHNPAKVLSGRLAASG